MPAPCSLRSAAVISVQFAHVDTLHAARTAIQRNDDFDLVLLDLRLPDTRGFEGPVELRRCSAKLRIVIISACTDPCVVKTAIVCGASGFIPKSASIKASLSLVRPYAESEATPAIFNMANCRRTGPASTHQKCSAIAILFGSTVTTGTSRRRKLISASFRQTQT